MQKYCYLNGQILPLSKASLPLNDIGVLRGYGVFDFLRTYHGQPFLFEEHWQRFSNSAKLLNLKVPISADTVLKAIKTLIIKNGLSDASIRLVLTGGISNDSLHFDKAKPNFFILLDKIPPRSDKLYQRGAELMLVEHQRELPAAKSNNYVTSVRYKNLPHSSRIVDLLYFSDNCLRECSTCNFFLIKGDKLITPKEKILTGMTRNFVLKIAKKNFQIEVREIKVSELKTADEAFLTTTTKEILPVVRVGQIKIGTGRPGPKTKLLMQLFKNRVEKIINAKS